MSALLDGPSGQLSDGSLGARGRPWAPTAHHAAVVLAAVKDAARRRRRWPEDGPSLTATARTGWRCAGRDGRMVPGRTEGCGGTSHFRFPRAVENSGSGSAASLSARPISCRSWRPVDCHNSNLASFYFALVHHSMRPNSVLWRLRPSLPQQILGSPRSILARRTDHKPSETVTENPGKRHQKPCSGSFPARIASAR